MAPDKQKVFLKFHRGMEDYFDVCCQVLIEKELIKETEKSLEKASAKLVKLVEEMKEVDEEYSILESDVESYQKMLGELRNQLAFLEVSLEAAGVKVSEEADEYGERYKRERPPTRVKIHERGHLRSAAYLERLIHLKLGMPEGFWAITKKVYENKLDMDFYESSAAELGISYGFVDSTKPTKKPPPAPPLLDPPTLDNHPDPDPNPNWCPNTCEFEEVDSLTDLYAKIR